MANSQQSLIEEEIKRWEAEAEQRRSQYEEAAKQLEQYLRAVPPTPSWYQAIEPLPILRWATEEQIQQGREALEASLLNLNKAIWRRDVWSAVSPFMAEGAIRTPQDILTKIPPGFTLDASDLAFVNEVYQKLQAVRPAAPPEATPITREEEAVEALITPPRAIPVGLSALTVEEIVKALTVPARPTLPPGMSPQEALDIFGYKNLDEMLDDYERELARAATERQRQTELIREGLANIEIPQLTNWEWLKMIALQPMLAAADIVEKYSEYWSRPFTGYIMRTVGYIIPGKQDWEVEMDRLYDEARAAGKNWWGAWGSAFEELELIEGGTGIATWNTVAKVALETLLDPLTYVGWSFTTKLVRPIPFVGKFLAAGNEAIIRLSDAPFIALARWWRRLPKTAGQEALQAVNAATRDLKAAIFRQTGKSFLNQVTPDELIKLAADARQAYLTGGTEALETVGGAVGKWQLLGRYIELDDIADILERIGVKRTDVTIENLLDINRLLDTIKLPSGTALRVQKGLLTSDEAAAEFFRILGKSADVTPEMRDIVSRFFTEYTDNAVRYAERSIFAKGASTATMIRRFQDHVRNMVLAQRRSPLFRRDLQHGLANAFLSRMEGALTHFPIFSQIDEMLVTPMARMYLLFLNYGPFNVAETVLRGIFRGVDMLPTLRMVPPFRWIPGLRWNKNAPIKMLQAAFGDVPNLPFDLARAEIRGEMWVTAPAGRTQLRRLMGIEVLTPPGIVRQLPERIIGKRVPAALRSLNNLNLYWADIQTQMRSWYFLKQTIKEMQRSNPELVRQIYGAIPDITNRSFAGLTKSDISDIYDTVAHLAFRGPEAIRANIQDITGWQLGKALKQVDELLTPMTGIDDATKEAIKEGVESGRALRETDAFIDEIAENEFEKEIAKRLWVARMYDDFAAQISQIVPRTEAEALNMVRLIGDAHLVNADNLHDIYRLGVVRGDQLDAAQRGAMWDTIREHLNRYLNTVEADLSQISATLRHYIEGTQPVVNRATFRWGRTVPDEVKDRIIGLIDNLPANIKINVRSFTINRRQVATGLYVPETKRITMNTPNFTDEAFYHEIGHSIMSDAIDHGDFSLAIDWTGRTDLPDVLAANRKIVPQEWSNSRTLYNADPAFRQRVEDFADDFARYILGTIDTPTARWFERHFPKQISQIRLPPERAATILARLDNWQEMTKLLTETRRRLNALYATAPAQLELRPRWWDEVRPQVRQIWDDYEIAFRPLRDLDMKFADILSGLTPVPPPTIEKELLPIHVAYIFRATGDELAKGIFRPETYTFMSKQQFVELVSGKAKIVAEQVGKTADQIGFTDEAIGKVYDRLMRNMGFDPTQVNLMTPKSAQLENIRQGLHKIRETSVLPEETVRELNSWLEEVARNLEQINMDELLRAKTEAMEAARRTYSIDFTGYDEQNMFDGFMRWIYPFWTYESQRFPWIVRNAIFRPSVGIALARYMNYTEGGYMPVPGTDLEVNPFRGTIFMGGFRRLWLRDYPEYYDAFPGIEILDYLSRFGFYPGIHIMAPLTLFGAKASKVAQLGELLPAWARCPIEAYLGLFPESASARAMRELMFPDRFREYLVMLELGKRGHRGIDILTKVRNNIALTDEEQAAWDAANGRISRYLAMEAHTAIFRFNPQERREFWKASANLIHEITGVSPEQQRWIRNHQAITGKDLMYYIGGLSPIQQEMLYTATEAERWTRVVTPLLPSEEQEKQIRIVEFWQQVEKRREELRAEILKLDQLFINNLAGRTPDIGADQWRRQTGDILGTMGTILDELKALPRYADVPITYEERVAAFEEQGRQPTFHPISELLWRYYELEPEMAVNPDTGVYERDWDTYWRHTEAIIQSLPESVREEFIESMQRDWTPLRKLWWQVSRDYVRKYRNVREVILERYSPEEQVAIRRYPVASEAERAELEQITRADGRQLISAFNDEVRTARRNLRILNPELDAWLMIFGITRELLTPEAETAYQQIVDDMIRTYGGEQS